jgi:hypothetical protein
MHWCARGREAARWVGNCAVSLLRRLAPPPPIAVAPATPSQTPASGCMRLPFGARARFALFGLGALGGSALSAGPALAPVGRPPLASRPRVGQQPAAGEEPHGVLARASVALRCGGAPKNQCQNPFKEPTPEVSSCMKSKTRILRKTVIFTNRLQGYFCTWRDAPQTTRHVLRCP